MTPPRQAQPTLEWKRWTRKLSSVPYQLYIFEQMLKPPRSSVKWRSHHLAHCSARGLNEMMCMKDPTATSLGQYPHQAVGTSCCNSINHNPHLLPLYFDLQDHSLSNVLHNICSTVVSWSHVFRSKITTT